MWFVLVLANRARDPVPMSREPSPHKTPKASAEEAHLAQGAPSPYGKALRRMGLDLKMTAN